MVYLVFISSSKIQSESKSQLFPVRSRDTCKCLSVLQRYNLKANHNTTPLLKTSFGSVYQFFKDTIWKQITTSCIFWIVSTEVFISSSKIQSESKSQLLIDIATGERECLSVLQRYNLKANHNSGNIVFEESFSVYQFFKDTIWKQITTYNQQLKN